MSRSRRKTPIFGNSMASSEAKDKRIWHKRWRSRQRDQLAQANKETDILGINQNEVSSTWDMLKDGKSWYAPTLQMQHAKSDASRRAHNDAERKALQARILARWLYK